MGPTWVSAKRVAVCTSLDSSDHGSRSEELRKALFPEEQPSPEGSLVPRVPLWGQDESLDLSWPHLSRAVLSPSTGKMHSAPSACSAAPKHPASPTAPTIPPRETSNRQEKAITNSGAATSQLAKAGERLF